MPVSAPEPIAEHHQIADFACGEPSLDHWLKRRARANQASGASRTYVACEEDRVVGYYALASGAVTVAGAPGKFRRNMPDPIPVVLLGRLAVDRDFQGRGMGRALFCDAAQRVVHASNSIGIRGIVVHAISDQAKEFYLSLGFDSCLHEPMMLVVTVADLRATLA